MSVLLKRISVFALSFVMMVSVAACKNSNKSAKIVPYQYEEQQFEISALSAPREMTEEAFRQYKDAGLNVLAFSNHDGKISSESLYYLGSARTIKALELCKKVGLDAYVAYGNNWNSRGIEGEDYFGDTPFSTHNYYSEYMDIIKGIRIIDEPTKEAMAELADDTLINDFKSVYSDKKYMINLIPATGVTSRNFTDYDEMLEIYGETIMSKFDTPYISVDVYPFSNNPNDDYIVNNYNMIAKCAKEYGAETTFILQSSTGVEFLDTLSEADMRWQAYLAIAFGADNLQYYSYSVPEEIPYNYCMTERDNKTPSELYYHVKTVNNEIQNFASAVLAYDWQQSIGISGSEDETFRVSSIKYDENFEPLKLENTEHYVNTTATQDLVVSRFASEKYGEAYMLVNFSELTDKINTVNVEFKDCTAVAIYGGVGFDGTPEVVTLDKGGKLTLELVYGEGVFVVPLV